MRELTQIRRALEAAALAARKVSQDGCYTAYYRAEMKGRADAYQEALDMLEPLAPGQSGVIVDPTSVPVR